MKTSDIIMKRGTLMEVPRPRNGRPGYAWIQGWTVVDSSMGTESLHMPFREAQAYVKELRAKPLERVQFHRLPSDGNGNPRYVCHYSWFCTDAELQNQDMPFVAKYANAVKRANQIGGSRYDFKRFRSGIAQQSYSLSETIVYMSRLTGRRYVDYDR